MRMRHKVGDHITVGEFKFYVGKADRIDVTRRDQPWGYIKVMHASNRAYVFWENPNLEHPIGAGSRDSLFLAIRFLVRSLSK